MKKKVLLAYLNLPMMFTPAIAAGLFNAIAKQEDIEFELFETAEYSDDYMNRHVRMAKLGANRGIVKTRSEDDYWWVKPESEIVSDFVAHLERFQPDFVLIHAQEDVWAQGLDIVRECNRLNIPHMFGGVLCISEPDWVLSHPEVNMICRYEGEEPVRQLYKALNKGTDPKSIDGVWYKDDQGNIKKNKPCPLVDINAVSPDFSCYGDKRISKRWARSMGGRHFNVSIAMETYRGCPYNCTYCNSPTTRDTAKLFDLGNFMRRKSIDTIERELVDLIETWGLEFVTMVDDSFLARPAKEIFDFAKMWSKYKIPFWMNTRVENCKPEYLEAMKEAGMYRFNMGIESGNEEYRFKYLSRKVKDEVYHEYFDYINESNIPYGLNVIIGMPYETREHVMDTARMLKRAAGWDGLTISGFQPYRGTNLRQVALDAGFIPPEYVNSGGLLADNEKWSNLHMPKPYLQPEETHNLIKTLPLYAFYDEDQWDMVREAETNEELYQELLATYRSIFYYGEYQAGGKDRNGYLKNAQKFCNKHDISTTYNWEVREADGIHQKAAL